MKNETVTIAKDEYEKLLELARLVPVLIAENERLRAENKLLRDKVDLLVRRVFGSSSEKLDISQMTLDIGADFERALNEAGEGPPGGAPPWAAPTCWGPPGRPAWGSWAGA